MGKRIGMESSEWVHPRDGGTLDGGVTGWEERTMVRRSPMTDRMSTIVVIGLISLTGCRGLGVGGGSAAGYPQGPSRAPAAGEAPAACGFPPGTALSFAGRSTTAALDVQEVVGDPMSTEPADIYITRDAFDQGQHHGRLVCAIYVQDPTFVEITVHPSDGGRVFSPTPEPTVGPTPPHGVSIDVAVAAGRAALPDAGPWNLDMVRAVQLWQLHPGWEQHEWADGLSRDRWVWSAFFSSGDRGFEVLLDYVDGTVLGSIEYILN